jgi:hypothetical protein
MKLRFLLLLLLAAALLAVQECKMAVIGLMHSHLWGRTAYVRENYDCINAAFTWHIREHVGIRCGRWRQGRGLAPDGF